MRIAIAINVVKGKLYGALVDDIQVFKTFNVARKSIESNDHKWDGDAYNGELPEGRYRCYPLVDGEWHIQEIEVPK